MTVDIGEFKEAIRSFHGLLDLKRKQLDAEVSVCPNLYPMHPSTYCFSLASIVMGKCIERKFSLFDKQRKGILLLTLSGKCWKVDLKTQIS